MKILIADDDKTFCRVLSNELTSRGHIVTSSDNGKSALEYLRTWDFDVLILDITIPGMGGLDVLRIMRNIGILTGVIVLTANPMVGSAVEAMKLGACDYLIKPVPFDELSAVIQTAFEQKHRHS